MEDQETRTLPSAGRIDEEGLTRFPIGERGAVAGHPPTLVSPAAKLSSRRSLALISSLAGRVRLEMISMVVAAAGPFPGSRVAEKTPIVAIIAYAGHRE
jgi:hypothetical protein